MSLTGLTQFDKTLQTTHVWLNDLMGLMGWADRHLAYKALRTVLHALRDCLDVARVASLGVQLPLLLRGVYYEGWTPHACPYQSLTKHAFLARIRRSFGDIVGLDEERVARAVLAVLTAHLPPGELGKIRLGLPIEIRSLWG